MTPPPRQALVFVADAPVERPRASAFFRLVLAIPHLVCLGLLSAVAGICLVCAWFAIAFTGRFPASLYSLVTLYDRYSAAVSGYVALVTDVYPPFFGPGADATYDIEVRVPPVQDRYHRGKAVFRMIVGIPVMILANAAGMLMNGGAFLSWCSIVFTGKQSPRFREAAIMGLSYQTRASVYLNLQTEDWPTLLDPPAPVPAGHVGRPPAAPAPRPAPQPTTPMGQPLPSHESPPVVPPPPRPGPPPPPRN